MTGRTAFSAETRTAYAEALNRGMQLSPQAGARAAFRSHVAAQLHTAVTHDAGGGAASSARTHRICELILQTLNDPALNDPATLRTRVQQQLHDTAVQPQEWAQGLQMARTILQTTREQYGRTFVAPQAARTAARTEAGVVATASSSENLAHLVVPGGPHITIVNLLEYASTENSRAYRKPTLAGMERLLRIFTAIEAMIYNPLFQQELRTAGYPNSRPEASLKELVTIGKEGAQQLKRTLQQVEGYACSTVAASNHNIRVPHLMPQRASPPETSSTAHTNVDMALFANTMRSAFALGQEASQLLERLNHDQQERAELQKSSASLGERTASLIAIGEERLGSMLQEFGQLQTREETAPPRTETGAGASAENSSVLAAAPFSPSAVSVVLTWESLFTRMATAYGEAQANGLTKVSLETIILVVDSVIQELDALSRAHPSTSTELMIRIVAEYVKLYARHELLKRENQAINEAMEKFNQNHVSWEVQKQKFDEFQHAFSRSQRAATPSQASVSTGSAAAAGASTRTNAAARTVDVSSNTSSSAVPVIPVPIPSPPAAAAVAPSSASPSPAAIPVPVRVATAASTVLPSAHVPAARTVAEMVDLPQDAPERTSFPSFNEFRRLRPRQLEALLRSLSFVTVRTRGSHRQMEGPNGTRITLATHGQALLDRGTAHGIYCKITENSHDR